MAIKGLILSGGKGTRLRPITHTRAKQLVPVAGKPVLFYGIEAMREAGITDIGIIVGDTEEEIRAGVGDGSRFDVRITYIPQSAPLGLAHAVLTAEPFLGDTPFCMYLGDNLLRDGVRAFVEAFQAGGAEAMILLQPVEDPQSYGIAELDADGRVRRLVEKPREPQSNLALVGCYLFRSSIFEQARALQPSWRGELEITDAIQGLIDAGYEVESHIVHGWWKDTGRLDDILEANRLILDTIERSIIGTYGDDVRIDGRVVVEAGVRLERCHIRGPVVIGPDVSIADAYIGPYTAISHGVEISHAEIEHSIILEHAKILDLGARVEDSLIGEACVVTRSTLRPAAHRLMIGDGSRIEVL
jgi:glucose-1-phosphate thymidylyltransferase